MATPANIAERPLDEAAFLVVDVETTGLSAEGGDRVCEVGAVLLRGGAVVASFSSLVDPGRPVSAGAYAVNRISPAMLAGAPTFTDVAGRLLEMMNDAILVAYNAPFDRSFLEMELRLAGHPPLTNEVVDALTLARQLLPGLGRYPQANVARVLGIGSPVTHRALDDTMITARIFSMFLSMLKAYDIQDCADLHRGDLGAALSAKRTTIIEAALADRLSLMVRYLSPADGEILQEIVTPKEIVGGRLPRRSEASLLAFSHAQSSERRLQIDRILELRPLRVTL
jgi:DNA polymerase III epsilon subunit family exonuclease